MATEIRVPALGESVSEATVGRWFKAQGEAVKADEPVVELETEKVTLEVHAPSSGFLSEILVKQGETVAVGALLGRLREGAAATPPGEAKPAPAAAKPAPEPSAPQPTQAPSPAPSATAPAKAPAPEPSAAAPPKAPAPEPSATAPPKAPAPEPSAAAPPKAPAPRAMPASPASAKIAADRGVDLSAIPGSGKRDQVRKGDVLDFAAKVEGAPQAPPAAPVQAPSLPFRPAAAGEEREQRVPMTRLRQTIARRLKDAQNTAAMLTTFNEADMSAIMGMRGRYKDAFEKKHGAKLGFMGFFAKACVGALKAIPAVNAEIDGADVIYKNYYHLGVAVGTDKGLVVPVLRDCDRLSLGEIEKIIGELGKRARSGELKIEELQGGTFTITNGGIYGSLMSTPILNPPQSGILGMHKIQERPAAVDGKIEIRPMMYLALTYDHRIVDGREAVTFLVHVKEALEDPARLMLEI
ncbi:MAG: 2-oxoglutarate dehydrogenase complex dihydrolipoyllysine-residue succinyltransferase [Methylocapsa sp.]|nr:2-oxoglutarate dehydrogenase complex dihydrolipoyllysine-residue succinyltransferase [Methylocapsa sp.]